jgi:hypothetical protein
VRYLRRFSEFLRSTFLRLDWVPRAVAPDERTSRYIFDEKHYDEARRSVKYAAFLALPQFLEQFFLKKP